MMSTDWNIKCPHCEHEKEYVDDNWMDELIDTSDNTEIICDSCSRIFYVTTDAFYVFEADKEQY